MMADLTAHLWQSTVFAVAAGLLTVAFRANRAKVRYWLWMSASLKFLVPFSLLIGLGGHLRWAPVARAVAMTGVPFLAEQIAQPFSGALRTPASPEAVAWLPAVLTCLWGTGFLTIMLIRLRLGLNIRAAVRAGKPLGISAPVGILSSPGLLEPGVVGLLRPVLLLPEDIENRLTPSQLQAVLAHELCHVSRRDNLFAAIHMVVEAVFWFHPLVWWIGTRLVEEREAACDEAVLGLGSEPRIYAEAILGVCRMCAESPLACVSGITGANLRKRIEAIMTGSMGQGLSGARKLTLAVAGSAALAGPVVVGALIGMGHAPVVFAQLPAAMAQIAPAPQAIPAGPGRSGAPRSQARVPADPSQGHRHIALLLDPAGMTADQQMRSRRAALAFVQNKLEPDDVMTVLGVSNGEATVAQHFTADKILLTAAILRLGAGEAGSGNVLSHLQAAAKLLGAFPEKKLLVYFSGNPLGEGVGRETELASAIQAAKDANVAFYTIDVSGLIPQAPQRGQAGLPENESRRVAAAQEKFGSTTNAMARTYIQHGPADRIYEHGSGATAAQTWRYDYLESFHGPAEFEFPSQNGPGGKRIVFPPPLASYEGPLSAGDTPLPARHASFQIYPPGEVSTLTIPLDSLSGSIDLMGHIENRDDRGAGSRTVAAFQDRVMPPQISSGVYRANFVLSTGPYVCHLSVREQSTGKSYSETIEFEVK